MSFAPRIVTNVSYVMRINHETSTLSHCVVQSSTGIVLCNTE